jgi:hypothetical protein
MLRGHLHGSFLIFAIARSKPIPGFRFTVSKTTLVTPFTFVTDLIVLIETTARSTDKAYIHINAKDTPTCG